MTNTYPSYPYTHDQVNWANYLPYRKYSNGDTIEWWGTDSTGTQMLWEVFFNKNYYNVSSSSYSEAPEYHENVFAKYLQDWLDNTDSDTRNYYESKSTNPNNTLCQSWETYLSKSTVNIRSKSPFLWVYRLFSELLNNTSQLTTDELNRAEVLAQTQKKAVSAVAYNISYDLPSSANDVTAQAKNQKEQQKLQIYLSTKAYQEARSEKADNLADSTNDAIQQENDLMTSLIDQIQEMITSIFKQ